MGDFDDFIARKSQLDGDGGFSPVWMPDALFDFQRSLVEWSCRRGRSGIFADCGLGKTPMQLTWAENVVRKTNKPVLVLTPLAVAAQTVKESGKFGIDSVRSSDGSFSGKRVIVTNYERLHNFNPDDFAGVVCDESSILKHYTGATQKNVTRFMSKVQYRLLATATAAPNDYIELGTSSEALGCLTHSDMLRRFFRQCDDKRQKQELAKQIEAEEANRYFGKLSFRVSQTIGQWRLKNHAVDDFWRWVASCALACRKPSDLGFSDERFALPPLVETLHVIKPNRPPDGMLINIPAIGLSAERDERRRTMAERCGLAAELVKHDRPAVVWGQLNDECDELERIIPGAKQIAGRTPDDEREEIYQAFSSGQLRVIVIKAKVGAWGLNWQHCSDVVTFASHSYEQQYQSVRRCWRFGQKNQVNVHVIATEGESRVVDNLRRKTEQASMMFDRLVAEMNRSVKIDRTNEYTKGEMAPSWL